MTSFIQKPLPADKTLPEIIKEERQSNRLTLEELSFKTQISLKYLIALEKGCYHLLPGEIYLLQFIKKIAKLFHLNEKKIITLYQQEKKKQPLLLALNHPAHLPKLSSRWLTPTNVKLGFIGLAIISLLGYLTWEVTNIFTPPFLEISSPVGQMVTINPTVEILGKTEPEATLLINSQAIVTEPDGRFKQTVDLTVGLNVFKISANRQHTKNRTLTISILRQGKIPRKST